MDSYHKRKRLLEEKYGKLINVKPFNDDGMGIADNTIASHQQQKIVKQLQDITDEEGLKRAYETKDGLYQHYNKLFIAGTKNFPQSAHPATVRDDRVSIILPVDEPASNP